MPFAYAADGVRIHYHVEGYGEPLVLMHGLGGAIADWHEIGVVEELTSQYRLILIDGRGHGTSDKPHEPESYYEQTLAEDVIAVLDATGTAKAHFWGYSMGGRIGFYLAAHHAARFSSFIIGGMNPYERSAERLATDEQRIRMWERGKTAVAASFRGMGFDWPEFRQRALEADYNALIAASRQLASWGDLAKLLAKATTPMLIYAGETDEHYELAKHGANEMPNAAFLEIPALGHMETLFRSDRILPHVKQFLLCRSLA